MSDVLEAPQPTVPIEVEMKRSYLDYAMSVIVSRAIPDVRDGLKPVHRRILYAMSEAGCDFDKPYKKSARIVGEVMGKYHPHGDSAIYDSLVRMAQSFSMRVPLVDGQGNFGSMDGDKAAAMRYTESRLAKVAQTQLLADIDKDTVDYQDNYDGTESEPSVLPAKFPNLLVNGAGGIAVGMATNIPSFNLGEVIDATQLLIDNPDARIEDLLEVMPGPDFPTGGLIMGHNGIRSAYETGRGSVVIRARTDIEDMPNGKQAIVVTEIPYQVNKARMIERIAELVRDKKIEGISDLRDESSDTVRVVIEIKRDAIADVVLNQLFRYTPMQTSFGCNMLALAYGQPKLMNIKEILEIFIEFREEVITRRTAYLLGKARDRAHVLIGLAMAVANIDEVIRLIRQSPDPATAKEELMKRSWDASDVSALIDLVEDKGNVIEGGKCQFTETQAKAVLDLRLHRLTGLERGKIDEELSELAEKIKDYLDILRNRPRVMAIIALEMAEIKEQYATPRKTSIEMSEYEHDIEDLIAKEDMVVTVTSGGYIKRVPLAEYRAQRRGGKGKSGMKTHEDDITTELFVANTHTPVLFFTSNGKVFKLKVFRLPQGSAQSKGKALVNIFPLEQGETVQTFMPLPEDENLWDELHVMFATKKGNIRRNSLSDFHDVRSNGKIAIRLEDEDDYLVRVATCTDDDNVLLAAKSGKCVRFPVEKVRVFKSRTSSGVRGMQLQDGDCVVSMSILKDAPIEIEKRQEYLRYASAKRRGEEVETSLDDETIAQLEMNEEFILTITENGYGKRSSAYEYRVTNRGTQGIVNIETSERNGEVVASFVVDHTDQIMLMTDFGKMIRTPVEDIRIAGRNTQGVTIFKVADDETVVSAVRLAEDDDEGADENEDVTEGNSSPDAGGANTGDA